MPSLKPLAARRVFCLCARAALVTTLVACSKAEAPQEPLRSVQLITVAGHDLNLGCEFAVRVGARVWWRGVRPKGRNIPFGNKGLGDTR